MPDTAPKKAALKFGEIVKLDHPLYGVHPAVVREVKEDGSVELEVLNTTGRLTVEPGHVSKV
jgi:hypothetical protein